MPIHITLIRGRKHSRLEGLQDKMPGNLQACFGLVYLFNGLNTFLAHLHLTDERLYEAIGSFAKQEVDIFHIYSRVKRL